MSDVPARDMLEARVEVGFRYQDGEVLTPTREAMSDDDEIPEVALRRRPGDEWMTLPEWRDARAEGVPL